jgi:hypothetical protein
LIGVQNIDHDILYRKFLGVFYEGPGCTNPDIQAIHKEWKRRAEAMEALKKELEITLDEDSAGSEEAAT